LFAVLALGVLCASAQPWMPEAVRWPADGPLPAFETPAEKAAPRPPATDDTTPPPAEPVRCVAEFEPQEGVHLSYATISIPSQGLWCDIIRECQEVGVVYITVHPGSLGQCLNVLQSHGVTLENIEFQICNTNGCWTRDFGGHYVWGETTGDFAMIDQIYYPLRRYDDAIPSIQAGLWHMNYYEAGLRHEGGNFMSDGHGTVMCSDVLYSNNTTWSPAQCREALRDYYGADTTYVFQRIVMDPTGHIDLWAKMLNDTTVMVAQMQPDDSNYELVEAHAAAIAQIPTVYGTPFQVVRCPMPPVQQYWGRYYKSFLNSLIFNGKVLVPIYGQFPELSQQALTIYQAAMPDYEVIGIDCDPIAYQGGAIHCITIGVAEHIADYIHDAVADITPVSPPVQIPPGGGSFQCATTVQNLEADSIYTEAWVEMRYPSGAVEGPLVEKPLAMAGGTTITRNLLQSVPGTAPAGTYQYILYTGSRLPRVVNDSSYFTFTKTGADGLAWEDPAGWWCREITAPAASVVELPGSHALLQAHPNPFNPETVIRYDLPAGARVRLQVYDVAGRLVDNLVDGWQEAGPHEAVFDGLGLASGVYFARLTDGRQTVTAKLVLIP